MDELFGQENLIYTKVKDEVPTRYGKDAKVSNSLIADGCIVNGEVMNSIIFRGVNISKKVKISNSIIMQDSQIHENAILDNVILDKDVIVRRGKRLTGHPDFPSIINKGGVI
jgi:glucose-1-phosphate adenylyltransferase